MKLKYSFILLTGFCLFHFSIQAQTLSRSVIGATGSVNNQLSSTVGEAIINTGNSATLVLTQGFQQPDKLTGTFSDELLGKVDLVLYPNPTQDQLTLEITADKARELQTEVVDMQGRRVGANRKLPSASQIKTSFTVGHYAEGTYVLLIKDKTGRVLDQMRFRKTD